MKLLSLALVLSSALMAGCASTPEVLLELRTDPVGAEVYLSRRGEKTYRGKVGPLKGDVRAERLEEDFVLIGTSPVKYSFPLEEKESKATVLGVGGAVVLKYKEGVLRFEREGFEPFERRIRFQEGRVKLNVKLTGSDPEQTRAASLQQ